MVTDMENGQGLLEARPVDAKLALARHAIKTTRRVHGDTIRIGKPRKLRDHARCLAPQGNAALLVRWQAT